MFTLNNCVLALFEELATVVEIELKEDLYIAVDQQENGHEFVVLLPEFFAWCRAFFGNSTQISPANWLPYTATIQAFETGLQASIQTHQNLPKTLCGLDVEGLKVALLHFAKVKLNFDQSNKKLDDYVLELIHSTRPVLSWQPYEISTSHHSINILLSLFPALCSSELNMLHKLSQEHLSRASSHLINTIAMYEPDIKQLFKQCCQLDEYLGTESIAFPNLFDVMTTLSENTLEQQLIHSVFYSVARGRFKIGFAQFVEFLSIVGIKRKSLSNICHIEQKLKESNLVDVNQVKGMLSMHYHLELELFLKSIGLKTKREIEKVTDDEFKISSEKETKSHSTENDEFVIPNPKFPDIPESVFVIEQLKERFGSLFAFENAIHNKTDDEILSKQIKRRIGVKRVIRLHPDVSDSPPGVLSLLEAASTLHLEMEYEKSLKTLQIAAMELDAIIKSEEETEELEQFGNLLKLRVAILIKIGAVYEGMAKFRFAMATYLQAKRHATTSFPSNHPVVCLAYERFGCCAYECGQIDTAEQCFEFCSIYRYQELGAQDPRTVTAFANYASCLSHRQEEKSVDEAYQVFRFVFSFFKAKYGQYHHFTQLMHQNLSNSTIHRLKRKCSSIDQLELVKRMTRTLSSRKLH